MPTYSSSQRAQITQFCAFTQAKESIAGKFLKQQDWNLERALDSFYGTGTSQSPLAVALNAIFDKYQSPDDKDVMRIDPNDAYGTTVYIRDISVGPEEPVLLALHDLLSSSSVGEFEREAFVRGWTNASAESGKNLDTIAKQNSYMQSLRKKLTIDHAFFKSIYRATFKFGLTEGARGVSVETAADFWNQFFTSEAGGIAWVTPTAPDLPWLELWIEYATNHHKRPVNKDLWNMVCELCLKAIQPDAEKLEWWNEDGAWPMAVDDFMVWIQTKAPKLGKRPSTSENGEKTGGDEMDTS